MSAARPVLAAACAAAVALAAGGCGVPVGTAPATIAPGDVPYGLASPTAPVPAPDAPAPSAGGPRVFLVGPGDLLVPRTRDTAGGTTADRLADLLAALAEGPTSGERGAGLSTALTPGLELAVTGVEEGTATVDISGPADAPAGGESRSVAAQIVLTATSLPEVRAVLLTRDGVPVEAPLPSGQLTSAPLTAADYATFLTAPPT